MPPWLCHISAAQNKESKLNSNRWVQLATIGLDNIPKVRTVVFRGWSDSYEMLIYTDKRSQKYYELNSNNNVEICWLFSKSKCQFRIRGNSTKDFGRDRLLHWQQLSNKSKAMWGWPSPGSQFEHNKNNYLSLSTNEIYKNFILLKIDITQVDQLLLNNPIHTRRRWSKNIVWIEERINP